MFIQSRCRHIQSHRSSLYYVNKKNTSVVHNSHIIPIPFIEGSVLNYADLAHNSIVYNASNVKYYKKLYDCFYLL